MKKLFLLSLFLSGFFAQAEESVLTLGSKNWVQSNPKDVILALTQTDVETYAPSTEKHYLHFTGKELDETTPYCEIGEKLIESNGGVLYFLQNHYLKGGYIENQTSDGITEIKFHLEDTFHGKNVFRGTITFRDTGSTADLKNDTVDYEGTAEGQAADKRTSLVEIKNSKILFSFNVIDKVETVKIDRFTTVTKRYKRKLSISVKED